MADVITVPADVGFIALPVFRSSTLGATVVQGQPVILDSDGEIQLAQADTAVNAAAIGIAMTPGATGENSIIATGGTIDLGVTLAVGETYVVSATSGAIAPLSDLTTGDFTTIIGYATAARELTINIVATGIAKA